MPDTPTLSAYAFPLGKTTMTPGIAAAAKRGEINPAQLLARHELGDDGDISAEDRIANLRARKEGLRVVSIYKLPAGKVYVITEWDRSYTTVLFANEY